ncbi:MAG TPA: sortase [Candidatus Paceibacterota bacterium]|nr:sortase [Candidatus Paceibacterota bacterium]
MKNTIRTFLLLFILTASGAALAVLPSKEQAPKKITLAENVPTTSQAMPAPEEEAVAPIETEPVSAPKKTEPKIAQPQIVKTASAAEKEIPATSPYSYRLSVPAIGINAPVLALGLEPDGKMDVPDNYTEVGWYKHGARPGTVGAAVLGAHVDNGSSRAGVFKNLKNLKVGDDIYTTDTSGRKLHFRVVERKIYDRNLRDTTEVMTASGVARLNLITCHGAWLPGENTYSHRLVVFAELVS